MLIWFCAAWPRMAWAQAAIALDRFEPAAPSSSFLTVSDPTLRHRGWTPAIGMALSYADAPLLVVHGAPEQREPTELVSHQWLMHLHASSRLASRFELGVNLPIVVNQGGEAYSRLETTLPNGAGSALGDIRVSGQVGLVEQVGSRPGLSVLLGSWLPTGNDSAYAGAGQLRAGVSLLLGADYGSLLWRTALGRTHQVDDAVLPSGHSGWNASLAAAYRWHGWQLGPELWGSTAADGLSSAFARRTTNLEMLLALRYRWSDLLFSLGAGPGLAHGPGTPRYRAVFAIAFAPGTQAATRDPAHASMPAESRGTAASGSASPSTAVDDSPKPSSELAGLESDRDGDGITDRNDACPERFGQAHQEPRRHGCPRDTDQDGIDDNADACIDIKGVASNEAARHGCPADSDEDGIPDAQDACPSTQGEPHADPKLNGCRSAVTIQGTQLVLVQQIHFETGSDEILSDSHDVLDQLRLVLEQTPSIARVAVDGHTDNVGNEAKNLALSRRRALSVVRWLVQHGVDERRLEARGFGPRQPLEPNDSEQSRARNRRVEFNILKRTDRGAMGWQDGPVHEH